VSRLGPPALVGVLAVLLLATGTAGAYPTRMQAVAHEFTLMLSRTTVPGNKRVKIELANFGEDPHDLRLRRIGGSKTFVIPETMPGEQTTRTFDLRPGRYRLWCAIADHRELGMEATLRVRRNS
jgi:uncharacterized cupredoxin-like copper-binding protein